MARPIQHFEIDATGAPLYWRLPAVAALIGIAPETLASDCNAGRIPVRVAQFGERGDTYCNKADVLAYLRCIGRQAQLLEATA